MSYLGYPGYTLRWVGGGLHFYLEYGLCILNLANRTSFENNFSWRFLCIRIYLPNPCVTGRMWHKVNFKRGTAGLNSEFYFSLTVDPKLKSLVCLTTLSIAGAGVKKRDGLPLCQKVSIETQITPFKTWTWVADSISEDDNRYTAPLFILMIFFSLEFLPDKCLICFYF